MSAQRLTSASITLLLIGHLVGPGEWKHDHGAPAFQLGQHHPCRGIQPPPHDRFRSPAGIGGEKCSGRGHQELKGGVDTQDGGINDEVVEPGL